MARRPSDPERRLGEALAEQQALHDPQREPRNALAWLPRLRRWQTQRLEHSFAALLADPGTRPAAEFFLSDLYGDRDFRRRDADIARVLPMMQRLLPKALLSTAADAIELAVVSHRLDLAVAEALHRMAPRRTRLDTGLYAQAYREAGTPLLRARQIDLTVQAGRGLARAVHMPGVGMLLRLSRGAARAAGVDALQGFLERGYTAFRGVADPDDFLARIERAEREVSRRLFAGHPEPFATSDARPRRAG